MKKLLMFVCMFLLVFSYSSFTEAASSKVSLEKDWTITFSKAVDPATITKETVYVVNDKNPSRTVDVKTTISADGKKVIVSPNPNYNPNDSYTLFVTDGVRDTKGKKLKAAQQKTFSVDNVCANYANEYDSTKVNSDKIIQITKQEALLGACTPYHIGKDMKFNTKHTYSSSDANYFYEYAGETDAYYFIMVAGQKMFVDKQFAQVVTLPAGEQMAYYEKIGSQFILSLYRGANVKRENIILYEAPGFIEPKKRYTSPDGVNFYDEDGQFIGEAYNYFQHASLRVPTKYSADQLNAYLQSHLDDDSVMFGIGEALIAAQHKYNINALFLLAFAANESDWGSSNYAKDELNLFGYKIYDINPDITKYTSLEQNLEAMLSYVDRVYLTEKQDYARGATIGSKAHGLNAKYSTDPYWGLKIAAIMDQIDRALASGEKYSQTLAVIASAYNYSNIRPIADNSLESVYTHTPGNGRGLSIVGEENGYYEILDDYGRFDETVFIATQNAKKVTTY